MTGYRLFIRNFGHEINKNELKLKKLYQELGEYHYRDSLYTDNLTMKEILRLTYLLQEKKKKK
jgi:hypothetical protein